MQCPRCQNAELVTSREDVKYDESGLKNVTLHNINVRRCPNCAEMLVSIPRIEQLHRYLAHHILEKNGHLRPEEIRFLRKTLGWSTSDFAAKMHSRKEQISRWENGKAQMGKTSELLFRTLIALGQHIDDYANHIESLKLNEKLPPVPAIISLHQNNSDWCLQK